MKTKASDLTEDQSIAEDQMSQMDDLSNHMLNTGVHKKESEEVDEPDKDDHSEEDQIADEVEGNAKKAVEELKEGNDESDESDESDDSEEVTLKTALDKIAELEKKLEDNDGKDKDTDIPEDIFDDVLDGIDESDEGKEAQAEQFKATLNAGDFIGDLDVETVIEDKNKLNSFGNKIVEHSYQETVKNVTGFIKSFLPQYVETLIEVRDYYQNNQDILPKRKAMAKAINAISAKKPGQPIATTLKEADALVRKTFNIKRDKKQGTDIKKEVSGKKKKPNNQSNIVSPKGKMSPKKGPKKDEFSEDIDAMLNVLA